MKRIGIFLAVAAACAVVALAVAEAQREARHPARDAPAAAPNPTRPVADAAGNLHVPSDYASLYEYLGSWAIAADEGAGSKQMHIV